MERIKEALARARSLAESEMADVSAGSHAEARSDDEPAVISYTQTRCVELSEDHLRNKRIISGPNDPVAEYYKVLRTRLIQRMNANDWRSLGVTSPTDGVGKTITSINLAISLARELNHTVLLVDLDLRQPKINRYLFVKPQPGMSDYLTNDEPLSQYLVNPGIERLVVLPGGKPVRHSSELLSSPKMVGLARELTARYQSRFIVYDLPPILACDDVVAFSPYFDAALMVVEDGATDKRDLKSAINLLGDTPLIGTVLNKSGHESKGYGQP